MDLWDEREVRIMPTYEFKCDRCEQINEIDLPMDAPKEMICVECGVYMWRIWSPISAHFKGTGWGGDKK
jgi:putative FmdB family regulatory protein